ncbi:Serine/threonine protein kinase [Handroanthus impetiginosus]|uniref:non-specific serine/threonine protein kinase n=1 Tax=Handroanthus impetiginosus TaxID=429701 RepID=A0A2G9GQK2_9LAMI|nr:Serine/threonine protein kinase [Handroanthus impetiginosus]
MAGSFVAVVGAIGGGFTLIILFTSLFYFLHYRKFSNKDSETGSSDPSAVGQLEGRQFRMEELEQATREFNESNLIGCGSFGLVYKGLLCDGTVVAIKRRNGRPRQEFIKEVAYLSAIQHRNLVNLLGYCQERGSQMLVYEYSPNGSICTHLYDYGKDAITKLEFKQRLSIAIGAAKGLCHLHGLQPPVVHGNFKTANVLVDENFIAKVADAKVSELLRKIEDVGSSSSTSLNAFRDPELGEGGTFRETNDIYSFGMFLLELISGKKATYEEAFGSNHSMLQWVQGHLISNDLIDHRLIGSFTEQGMRDLLKLTIKCMSFPGTNRPRMENVALELDQIREEEITRTIIMGEGTETITPGSHLFTN